MRKMQPVMAIQAMMAMQPAMAVQPLLQVQMWSFLRSLTLLKRKSQQSSWKSQRWLKRSLPRVASKLKQKPVWRNHLWWWPSTILGWLPAVLVWWRKQKQVQKLTFKRGMAPQRNLTALLPLLALDMLNGPVSDILLSSNFSAAFPSFELPPFAAYNFCMVPANVSFCPGWVHHLQTGQGGTLNQACSPSFHKLWSIPLLKNLPAFCRLFMQRQHSWPTACGVPNLFAQPSAHLHKISSWLLNPWAAAQPSLAAPAQPCSCWIPSSGHSSFACFCFPNRWEMPLSSCAFGAISGCLASICPLQIPGLPKPFWLCPSVSFSSAAFSGSSTAFTGFLPPSKNCFFWEFTDKAFSTWWKSSASKPSTLWRALVLLSFTLVSPVFSSFST